MKTIDEFMKALETDESLKVQLEAMAKDLNKTEPLFEVDILVKLAEKNGYQVTVEEVSKIIADSHELDESELDLVTGGRSNVCFKDDMCSLVYNSKCSFDYSCTNNYKCSLIVNRCATSSECPSGLGCASDVM